MLVIFIASDKSIYQNIARWATINVRKKLVFDFNMKENKLNVIFFRLRTHQTKDFIYHRTLNLFLLQKKISTIVFNSWSFTNDYSINSSSWWRTSHTGRHWTTISWSCQIYLRKFSIPVGISSGFFRIIIWHSSKWTECDVVPVFYLQKVVTISFSRNWSKSPIVQHSCN